MALNKRKLATINKMLSDAQNATAKLMEDDVYQTSLAAHGSELWGQIEDLRRAIRKAGKF